VARRSPLLRVAQRRHGRNDDRKKAPPAHRAEWGAPRAAVVSTHFTPGATRLRSPCPTTRALRQSLECRPEPVGRAEPNQYGLYNMCDNVHEWCSDWFAPDYYAVSPERNPRVLHPGVRRRLSRRLLASPHQNVSLRRPLQHPPEFQYADYGFRVACDATQA